MVTMRLRVPRLLHVVIVHLRAGGALLVAAPAASQFLPWRRMDLREMGGDWRRDRVCCETLDKGKTWRQQNTSCPE
jgi:hypothetical protein